jgi:HPt (histidine-containing phosphotransfer) domain-containing protein
MNDSLPEIPGVDIRGTLARMGLDYEDIHEILVRLPESLRQSLADAEVGVAAGDSAAVRHAAHTLAGLAANFGVNRVQAAAKALELAARDNRAAEFQPLLDALRPTVEEAASGLSKLK